MLAWLIEGGIGPALVALPVNWAGQAGAGAARRWFRRLRRVDDLSRLVAAAAGASANITRDQFDALRRLLEDEQTWNLAGQGTVEDLVALIASCLREHAGEPTGDMRAVAAVIARGLLEFGVTDVDPELFQRLLFARLRRMETNQASRLDEAMLGLYADLAAWFTTAGELDARQSREVMGQLRRVLDRLPPARADRGEIAVYLNTLISWLSSDPWPRDQRFAGPALDAATLERKLRVSSRRGLGLEELDADDLARRCQRLVILGGPGSGKTWLARRTARLSAEKALQALADGDSLDEVELPLYTTCSHLVSADGDIRQAVVSSAFDQLADLGSSRLSRALREFFAERNALTVLLVDSLDEAPGSDDRLRQAETLPWRIILTSRPGSWNQQLEIEQKRDSGEVAQLQPLRYPADVESFIHGWFASDPGRADNLAVQIARRPGLQQAATVPLILAFYCVVGGDQPLPDFRRDLYLRVLRRMLTGRWRGSGTQPDVETCLRMLRAWAWSGASSDPVSGVGTWADDIHTGHPALGQAEQQAVGHVAAPQGLPDVDTGVIRRRFIHRSIREHLVAEHVASLPVDQAARELLPHLWHDRDWEHTVPAAVAMHPQHDQLLRDLICCATQSPQIPPDLSAIDAGWQIRKLLARIASETYESDWSPEVAGMIGRARVELAPSARAADLSATADWATSNSQVRQVLLEFVTDKIRTWRAAWFATTVAQLYPTPHDSCCVAHLLLELLADHSDRMLADKLIELLPKFSLTTEDKCQVRNALLTQMATETFYWTACKLADGIVQLNPTAEDTRRVRSVLLGLLASPTDAWDVNHTFEWNLAVRLHAAEAHSGETRRDLLRLLDHQDDGRRAASLACGLAWLGPTADEARQARSALLGLLDGQDNPRSAVSLACELARLDPTADEGRQARSALLGLLDSQHNARDAAAVAHELVQLDPTSDEGRRARSALLGLLDRQCDARDAASVARELVLLDPTAEDCRPACSTFLNLLLDLVLNQALPPQEIAEFVACLVRLAPEPMDKRKALQTLLARLSGLARHELVATVAQELMDLVIQLTCTQEDRRQAQAVLLGIATGRQGRWRDRRLVDGIVQLAPSPEDKRQARDALLKLMRTETDPGLIRGLADGVAQLACTPDDRRHALDALLGIATGRPRRDVGPLDGIVQLAPSPEDKRQARDVLLKLIRTETDAWLILDLAYWVAQLDPTQEDKRQVRDALLKLMRTETGPPLIRNLAGSVAQLDPTQEDKRQARDALLKLMRTETGSSNACHLAEGLAQLDPTADDEHQGSSILTRLLATRADSERKELFRAVEQLNPTVDDLSTWHTWGDQLPVTLLATARRNSPLASWLAALPSYATWPVSES